MTTVDFIKTTLLNDFDDVRAEKPYLAFFLIAAGIEFLGKCLNSNKDWYAPNTSRADFESAICTLRALQKYKKYTCAGNLDINGLPSEPQISLYKNLRCGLLHAMFPGYNLSLANGSGEPKEEAGMLTIYADTFYNDFKEACLELINMDWPEKDKNATVICVTTE